MLITVPKCE